jgi:hypothetical protein
VYVHLELEFSRFLGRRVIPNAFSRDSLLRPIGHAHLRLFNNLELALLRRPAFDFFFSSFDSEPVADLSVFSFFLPSFLSHLSYF